MVRIRSEVFEQYAKLAEESGLTSVAYPNLQKYMDDPEARAGSDDISTIEALYGVKPDGQDYSDNIMQQAHPNSVIIAPSYDKINGLVENNIEQHNIMCNIVEKPTNGNLTNPKYAQKELIMELVRIANEMDNKNKEELFKLADDCLIGIHKEALSFDDITGWFKSKLPDAAGTGEGALAGAGIGAAIGALITAWTGPGILAGIPAGAATGAAIGGIIAAFTKTTPQVKNVEENAREVIKQLKDLKGKIPGQDDFFGTIDKALNELIDSSQKYQAALNSIKIHTISNQAGKSSPEDNEHQEAAKIAAKFIQDVNFVKKYSTEFSRRAKSGAFSKEEPSKVLKPLYWFMDDSIEDVQDAFISLEAAITKLEEATKDDVGSAASSATSSPSTPPADSKSEEEDDGGIASLIQHFTGKPPTPGEIAFLKHVNKTQ